MKADKDSMLLYVVTDRTWLRQDSLENQVEAIIKAGATLLQLREKDMSYDDFFAEAIRIKKLTDQYKIPFIINDNIEVALACGADGVHVGQEDMDAVDVRSLLGPDKILGVSVQTTEQALLAEKNGADYLGVGAVFSTSTKLDAADVTTDELKKICSSVSIPVVAIGGISEKNILQLSASGIAGVAVISAIFAEPDVSAATKELLLLAEKMVAQ